MTPLIDTNVLGELARPDPDEGVLDWARTVTVVQISVVTLEEIQFGLSWRPNARIQRWVDDFLERHCVVLPVTPTIARRAGWLRGHLQQDGNSRTQADMLIAGTAQVHGLTLVTRNERDFQGCAIPILNPFSA